MLDSYSRKRKVKWTAVKIKVQKGEVLISPRCAQLASSNSASGVGRLQKERKMTAAGNDQRPVQKMQEINSFFAIDPLEL